MISSKVKMLCKVIYYTSHLRARAFLFGAFGLVNEGSTPVLDQLSLARADGRPWHVVARILKLTVQAPGNQASSNPVWEAAGNTTGLSVLMLKRYVSTLERIEAIAAANNRDIAGLLPASFTGAEVAVRLY